MSISVQAWHYLLSSLLKKLVRRFNNDNEIEGINTNGVTIKKGFPPKPVAIDDLSLNKSLTENGIKNKETLIVEEDLNAPRMMPKKVEEIKSEQSKIPASLDPLKVNTSDGFFMYRRIVEANDSCLFISLGLAFNNSLDNS